jgi:hypothetical protein
MSNRRFYLIVGALALVIAGFVSYYASSSPDGLVHVAQSTGFLDTASDHATADGPLADYSVKGVHSERLSGGLAGVIGVLVTLVIAGGLALVLRRRNVGVDADAAPTEN